MASVPNSEMEGRRGSAVVLLDIFLPNDPNCPALLLDVMAGGGILWAAEGDPPLGRFAIRGILVGVMDGSSRAVSLVLSEALEDGSRSTGEPMIAGKVD